MTTHRSYRHDVRPHLGRNKGMAHITGGGITDNLPRVLPEGTDAVVRLSAWNVPPIFQWLQHAGAVPPADMLRTFNMGVGLILVVSGDDAEGVMDALHQAGEPGAKLIGAIGPGSPPSRLGASAGHGGQVRYS